MSWLLKKFEKNRKNLLHFGTVSIIIQTVVTLIALKREVAAGIRRFSVERMSSSGNWRQVTVQINCLPKRRNNV